MSVSDSALPFLVVALWRDDFGRKWRSKVDTPNILVVPQQVLEAV